MLSLASPYNYNHKQQIFPYVWKRLLHITELEVPLPIGIQQHLICLYDWSRFKIPFVGHSIMCYSEEAATVRRARRSPCAPCLTFLPPHRDTLNVMPHTLLHSFYTYNSSTSSPKISLWRLVRYFGRSFHPAFSRAQPPSAQNA